jgi:hypothetical protein
MSETHIFDSVDEWCDLFTEAFDKSRVNEILDAVNAKDTDHATIIVACAHMLGALLKTNDDSYFPLALMAMIVRASEKDEQ